MLMLSSVRKLILISKELKLKEIEEIFVEFNNHKIFSSTVLSKRKYFDLEIKPREGRKESLSSYQLLQCFLLLFL